MNIAKKAMSFIIAVTLLVGTFGYIRVEAANISQVSISKPLAGMVVLDSGTLNVRQSASSSSPIVSSLSDGSYVMVVGQSGDFYRVQYNTNGSYGYVSKDFVMLNSAVSCYLRSNISSGNLTMRSGASISASVVASIPKDTSYAFLSDDSDHNGWYYGVYGNRAGYTSTAYSLIVLF